MTTGTKEHGASFIVHAANSRGYTYFDGDELKQWAECNGCGADEGARFKHVGTMEDGHQVVDVLCAVRTCRQVWIRIGRKVPR